MIGLPGVALIALAFGLSMDSFAVAVAQGASQRPGLRGALMIGGAFGLAQTVMPLLGWALGVAFAALIDRIGHWITFVVLGVLGARMIREGFRRDAQTPATALTGWPLLVAAIATSIDAGAAGITLPLFGSPIAVACVTIGAITAVVCFAGVRIGEVSGGWLGRKAEVIGGLVLIGLGTKILLDHLLYRV